MTLGSYININDKGTMPRDKDGKFAPDKDQLYMHEYGHYLQSQEYGWGYMISVGARSLLSIIKSKDIPGKEYDTHSLNGMRWMQAEEEKNISKNIMMCHGMKIKPQLTHRQVLT